MIKGTITFLNAAPAIAVTIGLGEDVKAPRDIAAFEKSGFVFDEDLKMAYKAFLAAKRQGDLSADTKWEAWVDNVAEVDLRPSRKQIEQNVALGIMTEEDAERLFKFMEADEQGEAKAPLAE